MAWRLNKCGKHSDNFNEDSIINIITFSHLRNHFLLHWLHIEILTKCLLLLTCNFVGQNTIVSKPWTFLFYPVVTQAPSWFETTGVSHPGWVTVCPGMKQNWQLTILTLLACSFRPAQCVTLLMDIWESLRYIRHMFEHLSRVAEVARAEGEVVFVSVSVSGASRPLHRPRLLRINLSSLIITRMLLAANIPLNIDSAASVSAESWPVKLRWLLVVSNAITDRLTINMMQARVILWAFDCLKNIIHEVDA